jgi:integrase
VQIIHATLYEALKQAVKWTLLPGYVADPVDPPKAPKREIKPLNEEQVKRLLKAADGDKLEALYVLAITTGMRLGELLGLQWKDLDLPAAIVQVGRTVFNGRIEAPKTAKGNRSIKLTETSIRALREHERTSEWVFCTNAGTRSRSPSRAAPSWCAERRVIAECCRASASPNIFSCSSPLSLDSSIPLSRFDLQLASVG